MLQDRVLELLRAGSGPLSGEAMSAELGVSRAAVWKAVRALRAQGYGIEAQSALGYRLVSTPDLLSPAGLADPRRQVGREVVCLPLVDSTNDECKRRATQNAPDGLAVLAEEQTGGKGRRGRSFQSPAGRGLYLSVLLRPRATPQEVSRLTAWTAVAACRAVEAVSGLSPVIKWPNDVLVGGKKLVGILTELSTQAETGEVDYVVVGIGVNVSQTEADFGPQLAPIATSLALHGAQVRREELARALLGELDRMYRAFPREWEEYLAQYRARCATPGREVRVLTPAGARPAWALGVEEDFTLRVRWPDGREEALSSGEVSVRGLLAYAPDAQEDGGQQ